MIFDMENLVRFVDASGNTLFYAKNGERIIRFGADGKEEARLVVEGFGDGYHMRLGSNVYHNMQLAENIKLQGGYLRPEHYPIELEYFEKRYFDREAYQKHRAAYYLLTEVSGIDYVYPAISVSLLHPDTEKRVCLIEKGTERQFMSIPKLIEWFEKYDVSQYVKGQVMDFIKAWTTEIWL